MFDKTLDRKMKVEQNDPNYKPEKKKQHKKQQR
jgi:hypothetical protein